MTQHVYARLAGFRLAVMPRAPFRARHADEPPTAIDVEYNSTDGRLFARVIPDDGGYKSKIDQYTESVFDVVDIEPSPETDGWRIETSVFTCCWPQGYQLCSNNFPDDPGPFDLVGVNSELIYVQKPKVLPDLEEMVAPGQIVVDIRREDGSEWIELQYDHDGVSWCQRHELVTVQNLRFAVTMQAPSEFAKDAVTVARQVAQSLAPYEGVS